MPMIDLTMTKGALKQEQLDRLAETLTTAILYWVSDVPADAKKVAWIFVHEIDVPRLYVAGRHPDKPRYRLELRVLDGGLDTGRCAGIFKDVTQAILDAEGVPNDIENASRVWCIFQEIKVGEWGMGGAVYFRGGYRSGLKSSA